MVLVGDRGMLTEARIREEVEPGGLDWISALRGPAIRALVESGAVQLSLFDERDLVEVTSDAYPGERLMVCRNPLLAEERARKRAALLDATEAVLAPIAAATRREKRRLSGESKIGARVGKVIGRYKMAKHFEWSIDEKGGLTYRRNASSIAAEAALDGLYVVRTSVPEATLDAPGTVRAYKRLSTVERAFRSLKTVDLKVRPVFHRSARASPRPRSAVHAGLLRGMAHAPAAQPDAVRRRGPRGGRGRTHVHRGTGPSVGHRTSQGQDQAHCRGRPGAELPHPARRPRYRHPPTPWRLACPGPSRSRSSPGPRRSRTRPLSSWVCGCRVPSNAPPHFFD